MDVLEGEASSREMEMKKDVVLHRCLPRREEEQRQHKESIDGNVDVGIRD